MIVTGFCDGSTMPSFALEYPILWIANNIPCSNGYTHKCRFITRYNIWWRNFVGYGKRGRANFQIEGILVNMSLVIEVIDELQKLETTLLEIKEVIGDNGFVILHEIWHMI